MRARSVCHDLQSPSQVIRQEDDGTGAAGLPRAPPARRLSQIGADQMHFGSENPLVLSASSVHWLTRGGTTAHILTQVSAGSWIPESMIYAKSQCAA
jgi:hypothetical protein